MLGDPSSGRDLRDEQEAFETSGEASAVSLLRGTSGKFLLPNCPL